jgi:hypothetical protein
VLLALVTVVCLGSAFFLFKDTHFLMPGPLASAHGTIEKCSACHTKSGSGKLSWMHGLVAGDPAADSKACLTCHKMPDTAFNAHSATVEVLKRSTERLTKIAAETPQPQSARAQNIAFPTHDVVARDLYCATCHQEHKGVSFNLNKISNEQCRSCHVVKFDSFDGHHPKFENYPFKQRTPIIYDHAGHFGKHFPEVAKKDPARRIPETCSTCHDSREDKRIMAVAPFEKTCTACHLNQIIGKERVSGPKGIAFLSLPGLDLQTLKKKNASIGEWPDASDAALTPFMKVMIGRDDRGRALIKKVDSLNLQDLTNASDDQIKAVTNLIWETKRLFHALIKGKASDVLGDLNIGGGAKLSAALVADLTASIPRDVVISAQQQWLPNLATEMANHPVTSDQKQSGWNAVTTESRLDGPASPAKPSGSDARQAAPKPSPQAAGSEEGAAGKAETTPDDGKEAPSAEKSRSGSTSNEPDSSEKESGSDARESTSSEAASKAKLDPPVCTVRIFGQCLVSNGPEDKTEAVKSEGATRQTDTANAKADDGRETRSANELPPPMRAGIKVAENAVQPEGAAGETDEHSGVTIKRLPLPSGTSRAIDARTRGAEKAAQPERAAGKPDTAKAKPDGGKKALSADEPPRAIRPAAKDTEKQAQPEEAAGNTTNAKADGGKEKLPTNEQPQGKATDQRDDLLFPTEEELRAIKAPTKDAEKSAQPAQAAGKTDTANAKPDGARSADAASKADANAPAGTPADSSTAAQPQTRAAPVISIESDVDPESWAEYGGWYRQDYAIFYRPIGHKDKFIYSWLFLTGPQAPKGGTSPAAAVFDVLTSKDAQGSCTKCHSVDDIQGKGRVVNFSPPSVASKQGRFTNFIHEPHFGILENRGCLTCHELEKGRPYLKSYEQGNPQNFVSNFGAVKKDLCQTCHTASTARQDCLLCHKYHVNGVVTPIMSTKLPAQ